MPLAVSKILAGLIRLLQERAILVLSLMLGAGVAGMLWYVNRTQSNLVTSIALQNAVMYSKALAEFRTLYTSEVVQAARSQGIEVTHDYHNKPGAIPLPATLSMLLGQRIGVQGLGVQVRLYSAYPFPWRREKGGLGDAFGKDAWAYLQRSPDRPFYRFEEINGRRSLRYATADLMRPSCVNCHNTHPDSPKTDWNSGEVRGVLEVTFPLDAAIAQTRAGLRGVFGLLVLMSVLGVSGLAIVFGKLRRSAAELQSRARALEKVVKERARAEEAERDSQQQIRSIVDTALDAVITMDDKGVITGWNSHAEAIFGFSRREAIGRLLSETIIPPSHRAAHQRGLQNFLRTGRGPVLNKRIEITALRRDGHEFAVELTITPIPSGASFVFSAFVRDITERKEAQQRIRSALEESEKSREELEQFNRFAVGRELRIIELKEQVNALLSTQGKPAMYEIDPTEKERK